MTTHGKDFELNLDCQLHFRQVAPDKLEPDWVEHALTGELPAEILTKISDFIANECHDDLLEYMAEDARQCAAG